MRRRVLARELKELRRAAGLTHVDVANRLGWQQGKVSKIEGARQSVPVEAVMALSDVCGATRRQRDQLVGLAKEAGAKGWWESYNEFLNPEMRTYVGLEAEADDVAVFASETIPDLLQEEEYANRLLAVRTSQRCSGWSSESATAVERRLELLLRRQKDVLEERSIGISVVLSESALRRAAHGSGKEQPRRLAELGRRPNIVIRVLPLSAGTVPTESPFSLLSFRNSAHPDIVFLPRDGGGTYLESISDLDHYRAMLVVLETMALSPDDSTCFLDDCAA